MILSHDNETIIALCTPKGSGALALLRISGSTALTVAATISRLPSGVSLAKQPSHTVHYGMITQQDGAVIDHVLCIVMHGPKTFTGQDTVEITCHNNPFIVEHIIQQAIMAGARMAKEGEFTRRAVLNNKIDLVQAEAINELIHANTYMALKKSLSQLEGTFSQWIQSIEKELVKALAFSEASFEFIDEEMEFGNRINAIIDSICQTIVTIKKNFNQQQQIRQGIRIALIGSVNAGKSSLFNALLNKKRAIVTSIAGTTRDAIEAGLYKNNNYWTLIDTAGLRNTDDVIEQEGIARSMHEAKLADIILLIVDQSRPMTDAERDVYENILTHHINKVLIVHTKNDCPAYRNAHLSRNPVVAISSTTLENIPLLERLIEDKITSLLEKADAPFLLNQRQFNLILGLENKLAELKKIATQPSIAYEILSFHLNDALAHLSELTGKTISEQGMDAVFREFCVGK